MNTLNRALQALFALQSAAFPPDTILNCVAVLTKSNRKIDTFSRRELHLPLMPW